jgi:preprotein translocase subunit SecG
LLLYFLYALFILSCIVLVVAVLLQPGKADAGALFTSSVSSTAFGPRGTQTILAKITIAAAALFMLVALTLSLPAVTGSRSVVDDEAETAPAQPTASPVASPAPGTTAPVVTTETPGNSSAPAVNANVTVQPQTSPQQNK